MRFSFLLVLVIATFVASLAVAKDTSQINNVAASSDAKLADGGNTARNLKSVTEEEEESINADDEERGWKETVTKMKATGKFDAQAGTSTGIKWQSALEKLKASNALKNAEKVAGQTTTTGNKWQSTLAKLKASNGLKNVENLRGPAVNPNKWQSAVAKIQAGKLNKLDTTNSKWKTAFTKLKASGQLKNVDEAQIAKVTEGAAKELVKNPGKSKYIKKFLEITFGVVLTGLIVLGFNAMIS